jgi:hypothetical protein
VGDAPYRRDDRIVATSPDAIAPEYRMRAVVRREFHADSPAVRLVIEGPLTADTEYWDSHHAELAVDLIRRALPELRQAEQALEVEWREWSGANALPAQRDAAQGEEP